MSRQGCRYLNGACLEIVEKCEGCGRIVSYDTGEYCGVFPNPEAKWHGGICNFATHVKKEIPKDATGKKINPLKAAKRASKGR